MKKTIMCLIVLLCGCSSHQTICKLNVNNTQQNYKNSTKYIIISKNNYVKSVDINERYTSNDNNVIDYYKSYLKLKYLTLNEQYGNIKYEEKEIKKGIQYNVYINFDDINIAEMAKDNYIDKDYVVNNRLTLNGIIKHYESKGAICK